MDLALNNQQKLICHKTQPTNQSFTSRPLLDPAGVTCHMDLRFSVTLGISHSLIVAHLKSLACALFTLFLN